MDKDQPGVVFFCLWHYNVKTMVVSKHLSCSRLIGTPVYWCPYVFFNQVFSNNQFDAGMCTHIHVQDDSYDCGDSLAHGFADSQRAMHSNARNAPSLVQSWWSQERWHQKLINWGQLWCWLKYCNWKLQTKRCSVWTKLHWTWPPENSQDNVSNIIWLLATWFSINQPSQTLEKLLNRFKTVKNH